jgi:hypothetical protein
VSCISSPWSPRRATVSRMHVVSVDNRQPHECCLRRRFV